MVNRDVVVVGASAGGVEALRDLMRDLPATLPATVLVVLHLPASAYSVLPAILDRSGPLPARAAEDGERIEPGTVLVAPPDRHLILRDDRVALGRGPKENGHRPAVDPLFRSAARSCRARAVGVVLSGALDDGAAGLLAIARHGGATVVQDPEIALYDGMPRAALRAVPQAQQAAGRELSLLVAKLCAEEVAFEVERVGQVLHMETEISQLNEDASSDEDRTGRPAAMSCPDCHGVMFEFDDGNVIRYRCRVGHAWSPESLRFEQREAAEAALWAAIRTLQEKAALHRNLAERSADERRARGHAYHVEQADDAERSAAVLREMLREPPDASPQVPAGSSAATSLTLRWRGRPIQISRHCCSS